MAEPDKSAKKHHIDDDGAEEIDAHEDGPDDPQHGSSRKRQRVRLSCLECRRRKLSCSRELPCDRCIKSGTPERCTYESKPGASSVAAAKTSFVQPESPLVAFGSDGRRTTGIPPVVGRDLTSAVLKDVSKDQDRIRKLELEVAQLRTALAKQVSVDGNTLVATPSSMRDKETPPGQHYHSFLEAGGEMERIKCKREGNEFRVRYYGPNNSWSPIKELTGISSFMRDTAIQWLQPLNIHKKDRPKRKQDREWRFNQPDPSLEALLPSKEETDSLVSHYLDEFEQLHRIVHIPTFKKDYATFWDPDQTRAAALTALVLTMLSVSCCLDMQVSSKFVGIQSRAFQKAEKRIIACSNWMDQQSHKYRRLVHYQIMCLLYLAKRVNVIKKKRFWTESGSLIRNGMIVGLQQDPDSIPSELTPYNKEMRRRLWSTMVEFDIQSSIDIGAPTLLRQIYNNTDAPRNIDDESFGPDSTELPPSRPNTEYTYSSYAHLSRQSLSLRLDLNKLLTGPPIDLDWEQVLQFTDMISKEIDALPTWDFDTAQNTKSSQKPELARTLLHIQLKQYLLLLHLPLIKLRKSHTRYQTSELIFYTTVRDIILMHDQLSQKGIKSLYFIREDALTCALNLSVVALNQPKDSLSLIAASHKDTLQLIDKCIRLHEDRIFRRGNIEPWGYSSLCAAYGLLETHLGLKTEEGAKAAAAERFLSLHYKLLSYQEAFEGQQKPIHNVTTSTGIDQPSAPNIVSTFTGSTTTPAPQPGLNDTLPVPLPWMLQQSDPNQLMVPNPEFNFDLLGSDLHELWGDFTGGGFGGSHFM
ncbi:fungal-specific transcription factor domain-containing protein [Xylariaceae sp. FL0255]|nr:fungal-specific transcription factor domain-containing protein [Xylariaceae sp. FL0255]